MAEEGKYLSAREAARLLGVKVATLYSYVSRGLIRSEKSGQSNRSRRYLAEDVHALIERQRQRQDPAHAAREALRWGAPVLESAITLITEDALYYRGGDAARLARSGTLEEVAALIWLGERAAASRLFPPREDNGPHVERTRQLGLPPFAALQAGLAIAASDDLAAYQLGEEAVARSGARILHLLVSIVAGDETGAPSLAAALARGWGVPSSSLLDGALILCADHELNASSFAARVVASTGAPPYAVVAGGLAALQGAKHGGQTMRVTALLREIGEEGRIRPVLGEWLRRGDAIPGFGHPLYPQGDPRARTLLALLEEGYRDSSQMVLATAVAGAVTRLTGKEPNIDFALATMELVLDLPRDAALLLFALGRAVGWIGHAIEQYQGGNLIRPRARYAGPLPESMEP